MRLHELTLEAFGPFPGREHIDFDALDQGILLVNGPTGSGKSSLLDAVTFALFGDVAGSRRTLRQSLRSHHAAPDRRPGVELTFSVGPQRWKIMRTPQWDAPKKRGTGTTARPASVQLSQWRDGRWQPVSTRIDEATQMINDTLGMGLDQFAQVVLLPQGEFAEFLRARPEDRRTLLERLFDVERFEAIERWFTDVRVERHRACEASLSGITAHMAVVAETVGRLNDPDVVLPDWQADDVDDLPRHLRTLLGLVRARTEQFSATARNDAVVARAAERAADQAEGIVDHHRAYAQALAQLEAHPAAEVAEMRRAIDAAAAVVGVLAAARRHAQAEDQVAKNARDVEEARRRLGELIGDADPDTESLLDALPESALTERAERLTASGVDLPRVKQVLADVTEAEHRALAAHRELDEASERAELDAQSHTACLATERAAAEALTAAPDVTRERDIVKAALAVLARAPERTRAIEEAHHGREKALKVFRDAERHVIALRTARIESISGELAADLSPGEPCPVCGALEHPAPAPVEVTAPTPEQIADAEHTAAEADAARLTAETRLAAARTARQELLSHLDSRLSELEEDDETFRAAALVDDPTPLERRLTEVETALQHHAEARDHHEKAVHATASALEKVTRSTSAVSRAQAQAEASDGALEVARRRWNSAWNGLVEHHRRIFTSAGEASPGLPGADLPSLPPGPEGADASEAWVTVEATLDALVVHVDAARTALQQLVHQRDVLLRAREAELAARARASTTEQELHDELVAKGYETLTEARAVALEDDALHGLRQSWQNALEIRAAATAVVENEVTAAAAYVPRPDVVALRDRAQILSRRAARSAAEAASWSGALEGLESMRHRLADAVRRHVPLADAAREMTELAGTFTGIGENTHRMRLTSYVLAAHLETVTAMANERLHHMTDGRYQLQYTDERAKGTQRSGLGLLVVDAWTGRARDTATLSGGEAFMASLALALGLGDAVRADSGGMDLHTLFVDEGFGSLDQDTLEQVMEVLDNLREGGRLVGIVSHVSELRARIPTHIDVIKTAEGSRVRTEAAAHSPVFEPPIDGDV